MRWGWVVVALLLGALGVVAGYAVGSDGPLEEGALALAAATVGGLIALLGAFGIQIWMDHRASVRERRDRQEAVMLESYRGLVEIQDLTLHFAGRKRNAPPGAPIEGAVRIYTARAHLRPSLEMIDDNDLRLLAVRALDGFAMTAEGIGRVAPRTRGRTTRRAPTSRPTARRSTRWRPGSRRSLGSGEEKDDPVPSDEPPGTDPATTS